MTISARTILCLSMILLNGCPIGTPRDHYRPLGHQDTTIDISPTDDALVFNAAGKGGRDLFLFRLSDQTITRVAETADYEVTPSFSPDGTRIVYAAGVPGDRADHIFVIALDGGSKVQLTHRDVNDTAPRFSPDGKSIVFARDKTYNWGGLGTNWSNAGVICVIDADGSNERQLTPDEVQAIDPEFSEDGLSVFYFTKDGLFSVPTDGSAKATRIGPAFGKHPRFSRQRDQLVFSDGRFSPDCELFVLSSDDTQPRQITDTANGCFHPVFTHDGENVYFLMEEWPDGPTGFPKTSICVVNVDGTGQSQITDLTLFDAPLKWRPARSSIKKGE